MFFYVLSRKQASNYEITDEFFVNHINRTFYKGDGVSEALQMLVRAYTDVWNTTLKISSNTDASIK